jgi:ABC-type antimicrobial peptide transport system permease subunit
VATKLGIDDAALVLGSQIWFEGDTWNIVGFFEAPGTAFESEIWCDVDDIIISTKREEYSCISVVMDGPEAFDQIDYFCKSRLNLEMQAWRESTFYGRLANTLDPMVALVGVMVVFVGFGGVLAGMNTMYTAVLGRFREFGILRLMGFSRVSIFLGLILESIAIAMMGGMLGVTAASLVGGYSLRFPMGAFSLNVGPDTMLTGVSLALAIGFLGALVPGVRSMRMNQADAVRAV